MSWSGARCGCCPFCNTAKGRRIAHRLHGRTVRLIDPRRDRWPDHFVFAHRFLFVVGVTRVGRATEAALAMNAAGLGGPLGTRHEAILDGRYPPPWIRERLLRV